MPGRNSADTTLRNRKDIVVVQHVSYVGGITNGIPGNLEVHAVRYVSPDVTQKECGALVNTGLGHSVFVPESQIGALASAIDRLCAVLPGAAPFQSFRAEYRAECGLSISRSAAKLPFPCSITVGEGAVLATDADLRRLKDWLLEAGKRVDGPGE